MVKPDTTTPSRTSAQLVRQGVRDLLASSASYNVLPADRRRKIAKDTVRVAAYMVDPQGLLTAEFRSPLLAGVVLSETGPRSAGFGKPVLDAIQMSPRSMDALLAAVDFPSFVADLIQGVFGAIVNASVKQMEAYAALITAVSLSVDQFVQANITEDSARHALVNEFPNAASWAGAGTLRLKLHAPARSPNLTMLAAAIGLRELVDEPQRAREVKRVIAGARRRLARNRQQILATMILMGINRMVFMDGAVAPKSLR